MHQNVMDERRAVLFKLGIYPLQHQRSATLGLRNRFWKPSTVNPFLRRVYRTGTTFRRLEINLESPPALVLRLINLPAIVKPRQRVIPERPHDV